jgi:hypothetical protein
MDAQDFRSLQEAYSEVYSPQEVDEAYKEFSGGQGVTPRGKLKMKMAKKELGNILAPHHRDAKKQGERIERMKSVRDTHSPEKAQAKAAANKEKGENKKRAFGNRLMRSDGQGIRDSYDYYDIILSHLLDEGYASTEESADKIILNMSESWFEEIVEARRSEKEGKGSPESPLSYPGRSVQKERGEKGGRHWQSGGEGGSKTERGRKKSDKYSQAQRLRGLSNYPEKPGKYSEMQRKRRGGDIGSRFD